MSIFTIAALTTGTWQVTVRYRAWGRDQHEFVVDQDGLALMIGKEGRDPGSTLQCVGPGGITIWIHEYNTELSKMDNQWKVSTETLNPSCGMMRDVCSHQETDDLAAALDTLYESNARGWHWNAWVSTPYGTKFKTHVTRPSRPFDFDA